MRGGSVEAGFGEGDSTVVCEVNTAFPDSLQKGAGLVPAAADEIMSVIVATRPVSVAVACSPAGSDPLGRSCIRRSVEVGDREPSLRGCSASRFRLASLPGEIGRLSSSSRSTSIAFMRIAPGFGDTSWLLALFLTRTPSEGNTVDEV